MTAPIAVCLKRSFSTEVPPRLAAGGHGLRTDEAAWQTDPAARAALALGLRLAGGDRPVLAVAVGPADWDETLREALAAGAKDVLRLWSDRWPAAHWQDTPDGSATHTRFAARAAAAALRERGVGLVLTGDQSADGGHGCFAACLAQALGAGLAHRCVALDPMAERGWRARVKLERGYTQEVALDAPAVVSVVATAAALSPAPLPAWLASRAAAIPRADPGLPYPPLPHTAWRPPVPRVKRMAPLPPGLDAEGRIRAMVMQPAGAGGTVLPAEQGPAAQADALMEFLAERGYR